MAPSASARRDPGHGSPAPHRAWDALARIVGGGTGLPLLRVAVVAAHPDDEIMSAGMLLRRLSLESARIDLIHATDGAPVNGRDARAHGFGSPAAYARARRLELVRAVAEAEIACSRYVGLAIPDQQAARALVPVTHALECRLRAHPVDIILSHAYDGGHPDHDATAFAVHAAVERLERDTAAPLVVEFASYRLGPYGWEWGGSAHGSDDAPAVLQLSAAEHALKRRARDCFESQAGTLASCPLHTESFRRARRYNFTRRPNEGRLLYELYDWGLTGGEWDQLAARALESLRET